MIEYEAKPGTIFSFTLMLLVEQECFYWSVAPTFFQTYCGLCTVKAKNDNKTLNKEMCRAS